MNYLGDYAEDETVYFLWNTNDASGASITRSTDGTISVYKDNGATQSVAGVTGTEDFDSLTGIHECTIDTSADAFYATGADYAVVLSAATIDGQTVNAVLAHFSIENRTTFPKADYPTNFAAMGIESDGDLTKVNTLDGHTAQTGDNYARLGAPAGASVSADIAAVKSDSAAILTDTGTTLPNTLGTPAGADMSADIAAIKSDSAAILTDTADMQPKLGTPAADVSADIAAVKADTAAILDDTGTNGVALLSATQASIDAIEADTNELQTDDIPTTLATLATAAALATVDSNVDAILVDTGTTLDGKIDTIDGIVDDLKSGIIYGAAATGTLSTTQATSDLTGYADDQLIGRTIIWLSGDCDGEATDITDYASASGLLTFTALTTAPANSDTFKIV